MDKVPYRQIHLDFHTSPLIPDVGAAFDGEEFALTLKEAGVNSINLFAKCHHGFYYYPTKIGSMHPSLKIDLFGEQVKACRRHGIRACAYTTVVWNEDWADRHPEWLQVSMDGVAGVKKPFAVNGWRFLCMNNREHVDYIRAELKEICELYRPAGYWIDIIIQADCICPSCKKSMREKGMRPDNEEDVKKHARSVEIAFMKEIKEYIAQLDPEAGVYFNGHPSEFDLMDDPALSSMQKRLQETYIDIESLPSEHWGYTHFPINVNFVNREDKEICMMNGKFHKSWADFGTLRNTEALEFECFRALSYGAKVCVGDQLHPSGRIDRTVYNHIGKTLCQVAEKEQWCHDTKKVADIAVMAANPVMTEAGLVHEGAYRMLSELHLPFSFVDYSTSLGGYRLLILPDETPLTQEVAAKITAFMKNGGKVLATNKAGLVNGKFGIDLGVEYQGEASFAPRYLALKDEHFKGIPEMNTCFYLQGVDVVPTHAKNLANVVNPYFNRTWDHFCSHRQTPPEGTEQGGAIFVTTNTAYVAQPIFADYADSGCRVYRTIIRHLIERLLPDTLVKSTLPSTAELTVRARGDEIIVHVLHYIPSRKCRKLDIIDAKIPIYNQTISVKTKKAPTSAMLVPQMKPVDVTYANGYATFTVPEIDGHQMIALA